MSVQVGAVYQHYKGQRYRVLGVVRHSETLEELVHYEAMYPNDLGQFWVRPLAMFCSAVVMDGESRPRFALLS